MIPKSTLTVFHTNEPDLFLIENSQNSFQWIYIALKKKENEQIPKKPMSMNVQRDCEGKKM